MKHLVLLLFSMLCFSAEAQEPSCRPFVEDGKVWRFEGSNPNDDPILHEIWERSFWLEGDTVIGNHRCHKLYLKNTYTYQNIECCYSGALFEDGAQVFHIWPNSETPYLLYDFTCQKGDDVTIFGTKLMILERLNVQFNGSAYVVLKWCPKEFEVYQSSWIYGVGDPSGLIDFIDSWNPGGYCYKLLSCEVKGEIIFDYKTFQDAVTGCQQLLETYDSSFSPYNGQLFDLTGRYIPHPTSCSSSLKKGIYIENGRKRVVSR